MIDDDDLKQILTGIGEQVGNSVGNLLVLSTLQTRAFVMLAEAVEGDPNVTDITRERVRLSMKIIDLIIEKLESMAGDDSADMIRSLFGSGNERG